jgi:hypothetical protein
VSKVVINDLNGVDREIKPLLCDIDLRHQAADYFTLWVKDPDGTIKEWLKKGCKAKFYIDDLSPPTTLRLYGMVEQVIVQQPVQKSLFLKAEGREYFYVRCLHRIVTETYQNMEVSEIVKDLMANYFPEVDTTNVQTTDIVVEDIRFPYRILLECLDELASLVGYAYFCTPDLKLYWFPAGSRDSLISYGPEQLKVKPETLESVLPIRNRVYVIGGTHFVVDQSQEQTNAYETLETYWWAQSFIPKKTDLAQISLYLAKIGSPISDIEGYVCRDQDGLPAGETVVSFTIDKDFVSASPTWRPVQLSATVLANTKHWIVLKAVGSSTDTFAWYHDNGTAGEHAYRQEGTGWTLVTNSFEFAFKTQYKVPVLANAADYASKDKYEWRETVVRDDSITSQETARKIAEGLLAKLTAERIELREITVLDPTDIPRPGELVTISLPRLGINNVKYEVDMVTLKFKGGLKGAHEMELQLGQETTKLAYWLKQLKLEIEKTKIRTFGVEYGLLNLYRDLGVDSLTVSDTLSATEQLSGTFKVDEAKVGFSDVG